MWQSTQINPNDSPFKISVCGCLDALMTNAPSARKKNTTILVTFIHTT